MTVKSSLLVLLLFVSCACAATEPGVEAAAPPGPSVTADVEAFFAAMRQGDLATLGRYLADDYFLIGVGGNTRNRASRLASLRGNVALLSTIRPSELNVRHYGDVAVVTGLVTIADESPTVYERFTHVWARNGSSWQMVSGQVTAVAPEHQVELPGSN